MPEMSSVHQETPKLRLVGHSVGKGGMQNLTRTARSAGERSLGDQPGVTSSAWTT
jgi:hypothetical protein